MRGRLTARRLAVAKERVRRLGLCQKSLHMIWLTKA